MSKRFSRAGTKPSRRAPSVTAAALPLLDTVEQVEQVFGSDDPELRAHALEQAAALLRLRPVPADVARLGALCQRAQSDWSDSVRVALASAAGYLPQDEAWDRLMGALAQDGNAYVKRAARATLARRRTRSQERQLEEKIDQVLAEIESLSRSHSARLAERVRKLGRAYFTYTISGVAHELKAILTGLKRSLTSTERELVGSRKGPPKAWTQFRERTTKRIETMEKILTDAKAYAAQPPSERQRVSVHGLATEALEQVRETYAEWKGAPMIKARIEVDRNLEVLVPRHSVLQALTNLVRNAFEAMEEKGEGTLTVAATATEAEVRVSVADTGVGIPEEDQEIVFLGGRTTKRGRKGPLENTGWGLTYTQAVVEELGGWIEPPESVVGKGTTFTITLPRAHPDADPDEGAEADGEEEEEEA